MKFYLHFAWGSLLTVLAVCSLTLNTEAFLPRPKASNVARATARRSIAPFCFERPRTTSLFMVDDDEEDEDDEDDDDPLGNGVDSVAWLPTVIGAKGKEITSAREVSRIGGFKEGCCSDVYSMTHSFDLPLLGSRDFAAFSSGWLCLHSQH